MKTNRILLLICLLVTILLAFTCIASSCEEWENSGDCLHSYYDQIYFVKDFPISPATCQSYAEYWTKCSNCNQQGDETWTDSESGYADHIMTNMDDSGHYLASSATCTSPAKHYYSCKECGLASTETFEVGIANEHNFTEQIVEDKYLASQASCTQKAIYYYSCSGCGQKGTTTFEEGEVLSHDFTNQVVNDEYIATLADCVSPATYYYSCKNCGEKGTQTFESGTSSTHSYVSNVVEDKYLASQATCTKKATYYYSCSGCGQKGTDTFETGETLPHEYVETVADKYLASQATCTQIATYYYSCKDCGEKGTQTFGYGDTIAHQFKETVEDKYLASQATCTKKATYYFSCFGCGLKGADTFETGETLPHEYVETVSDEYLASQATCLSKAIYYKSCDVCKQSSEQTFEYGELSTHNYAGDTVCDVCKHDYSTKGLEYVLLEEGDNAGTYAVIGYGDVEDLNIVIPNTYMDKPVTVIEEYAFAWSNIVSISIPSSIKLICDYSFDYCYNLLEVCNLSSLNIVAGSTEHGGVALYAKNVYNADLGTSKITTDKDGYVTYTEGNDVILVGYVGNEINLVLPNGITEIYNHVFNSNDIIQTVIIPNSVKIIGECAFVNTYLKEVVIPDSVTEIRQSAFENCYLLTKVILGKNLVSIGNYAFINAKFVEITIPEKVTSIGNEAFGYCYNLIVVYNLSSLNIVAGSTEHGGVALYAKKVYNTTSETSKLTTDKDGYVIYTEGSDVILVGYVGNEINLVLPNGITEIYNYVFANCDDIQTVIIPDSVKIIGESAFIYCQNLYSVTIGKGVTTIKEDAFYACRILIEVCNLSSLNIVAGSDDFGGVALNALRVYTTGTSNLTKDANGYVLFQNGKDLLLVIYVGDQTQLTLPNGVTEIYPNAFYGNNTITKVVIPNGVITIGESAFLMCNALQEVIISDTVSTIGVSAFYNCPKLSKLVLGSGIKTIGIDAFSNTALTSVVIPDSVETIGMYAFASCESLVWVQIGNGIKEIEEGVFDYSDNLVAIYYNGSQAQWNNVIVSEDNDGMKNVKIYFFSATQPTTDGNYWHFGADGKTPEIWTKQD